MDFMEYNKMNKKAMWMDSKIMPESVSNTSGIP
jgi:hypothetical protein